MIREGRFCDLLIPVVEETGKQCQNAAVGTCALCARDYCAAHSFSDLPLVVSVGISRRTPGSNQLHTTKVVEATGAMCETCTNAFTADGNVQRNTVNAACDAAVAALAAMQTAKALETDPQRKP